MNSKNTELNNLILFKKEDDSWKKFIIPVCSNNGYFAPKTRKMKMENESLNRVVFCVNPKDSGGESLTITTDFFDNGDSSKTGVYINQKIELMSYCNSASLELYNTSLDPDGLRDFANQIEKGYNVALAKIDEVKANNDNVNNIVLYEIHFVTDTFESDALYITTKYYTNGDDGVKSIYINQELSLIANCNKAKFHLVGSPLNHNKARELANLLEIGHIEALKKLSPEKVA